MSTAEPQTSSHEAKPLSNASEVYRQLREEGLMLRRDGTGRDDALWRELVTKLGFKETIPNLADALERSRTSVEDFVRAFLTCFEPFARMMAEICLFMQKIDAKKGYHGLKIKYRFSDRDESVEFDLKHFREFWRCYATLYERAVYQLWSLYNVHQYVADIARHLSAYPTSRIQEQEKDVTWEPGSAVPDDFGRDATLASNARVVHSLYRSIDRARVATADLGESLLTARDRDEGDPLAGLLRQQEICVDRPPTEDELRQLRELLTQAHRDLARINACLSENKTPILSFHPDYRFSGANSLEAILSHYDDLPTEERLRATLVEQLEEILNLPTWKHRWQLYQVWVGFSVLYAFDDAGVTMTVHAPDGKLELHERHPAELAGLSECRTPIAYWAELETLLPQVTEGSRSIKPDYRLVRCPSTSPGNTILLVEAKQYKRMAIKDLIKLHARYRAGCPNGKLVFVNYDFFPSSKGPDADPNASFIQQFIPGNARAHAALIEVVGPLALSLRQEQSQIMDERSAKNKRELIELTNKAHELLKGVEFLRRVQSKHGEEQVGAVILDYRNPQKCLFAGIGKEVRSHVIQYLRANPLAQVWLAGTTKGPSLAYLFDYDSHRQDLAYQDCDLRKLISLIENSVGGQILIFGHSSALMNVASSRVITQGYTG